MTTRAPHCFSRTSNAINVSRRDASSIGRRAFLAGAGTAALVACTPADPMTLSSRSTAQADPLSRFRFFAEDGRDTWLAHLKPPVNSDGPKVLALSGGGEDGAFGAGALVGWSARGGRPKFDLVTGISTGALIAPFAFLGSDYDDTLRRMFTHYDASDIMRIQPFQAIVSDALYDTTPLAALINEFTPASVLKAVAARHEGGKSLFIVTSELETARASVWDMGAIAQAGHYDLFRAVMRASAALPGLFSPVELRYNIEGISYSETHMDGGVHMPFLAIPSFAFTSPESKLAGGHLFLMINNTLRPMPVAVTRSALGISQQALTTTTRAHTLNAVNATQLFARERGIRFSVASISPESGVVYDPSDRFSSTYMNALYAHGYERAAYGALWSTS